GAIALLLASLSWATGSIYAKSAKLPASQLLGTGMQMLAGGTALMLLALLRGEWRDFELAAVSPRSALALAYLTVIGSSALSPTFGFCGSPLPRWLRPMLMSTRWLRFCLVIFWHGSR